MSAYSLIGLFIALYLFFWLTPKFLLFLAFLYYLLIGEEHINHSASYSLSMFRDVSSVVKVVDKKQVRREAVWIKK